MFGKAIMKAKPTRKAAKRLSHTLGQGSEKLSGRDQRRKEESRLEKAKKGDTNWWHAS